MSQNSQENTCARVTCAWVWHSCFPVNFVTFLRPLFFTEHVWATASEILQQILQDFERVYDHFTESKVFKYEVISGPYFPVFGLNTEIYSVNLRIQSKYRKIRTRNNSVFGHFSRSVSLALGIVWSKEKFIFLQWTICDTIDKLLLNSKKQLLIMRSYASCNF